MASDLAKTLVEAFGSLTSLKYGKELDEIPIGNLSSSNEKYDLLFPDLFKALKFDINRNQVLLLLNDFLVSGVVKEKDVTKHKKLITDSINKVLKDKQLFDKQTSVYTESFLKSYLEDMDSYVEIDYNFEWGNIKTAAKIGKPIGFMPDDEHEDNTDSFFGDIVGFVDSDGNSMTDSFTPESDMELFAVYDD